MDVLNLLIAKGLLVEILLAFVNHTLDPIIFELQLGELLVVEFEAEVIESLELLLDIRQLQILLCGIALL